MAKSLTEIKFMDFKGLERNTNQPDRKSNLFRSKNMVTHEKPGTLTLREGYELRYTVPVDNIYARLSSREYVSFDNFFERTAGQGTEITVLVEKAKIEAPTISGIQITTYSFNSIVLWIRPYWTGSYWKDAWQWLNECWTTKITVAPDSTYKNKLEFEGDFGNLKTMSVINVTKDKTDALAILKTKKNGTNTTFWVDTWNPNWAVDDEIIIMRNYIPIKYLIANYDVLRKEISFHRVFSKMRIGFGGKENRVGMGVEYANRTLQLSDYIYNAVDPEILNTESTFATINKVVAGTYSLFGETSVLESKNDFDVQVDLSSGNFIAGTYYVRLTGVLNGTDEILIAEKTIITTSAQKFLIKPIIKLGSLSRRFTSAKTYFSENGDDYYLIKEYILQRSGNNIDAADWEINDDGLLTFKIASSSTDLHTESNAAGTLDTNSVGSWTSAGEAVGNPMTVIAATNFALRITNNNYSATSLDFLYPLNILAKVPNVDKIYSVTIRALSVGTGTMELLLLGNINGSWDYRSLKITGLTNAWITYSFDVTIPDVFDDLSSCYFKIRSSLSVFPFANGDTVDIELFTFTETDTQYFDDGDELGVSMLTELGYQPSFNLVRDWMDATVLNGITWLAGCWIEKRFDNKIFGSQISGLTANMHDVIPAQKFLDVDRYKGEVVVGIAVLSNSSMAVLKDGAVIIIDPDTGQKYETAIGYGCVIKNSILVIRGTLLWGSQDDLMKMSASSGYVAEQISGRFVRDIYQSFADKTTQHSVLDKYGAFRIALTDNKSSVDIPELLLTDRGWLDQKRYHHPEVYRNGLAGRVWFMNSGNIYAFPFDEKAFVGYADVYGNYDSGW